MTTATPKPRAGEHVPHQQAYDDLKQEYARALAERDSLRERERELVEACEYALAHVRELRDAWQRGALSEHDGKGGTRSNINVNVESKLRSALAKHGR